MYTHIHRFIFIFTYTHTYIHTYIVHTYTIFQMFFSLIYQDYSTMYAKGVWDAIHHTTALIRNADNESLYTTIIPVIPIPCNFLCSFARDILLSEGTFFDLAMHVNRQEVFQLQEEVWKHWRLDTDGHLPSQLAKRGVCKYICF